MIEKFKRIALEAIEQSSPVKLYEATVVNEPPNISIRLKGNSDLVIPKEIITVAEHLKEHRHRFTIPSITVESGTGGSHSHSVSGSTSSAGNHSHSVSGSIGEAEGHTHSFSGNAGSSGSHSHNFNGSTSSNGSHSHMVTIPERNLNTHNYDNGLKKDDHVMVAVVQEGQSFFIFDRLKRW